MTLKPGAVTETVTITEAEPLLQTQDSAVSQVISAKEINDTPLNGRNWVYIAQLTAGVAPPLGNTRGSGSGDFVANGQRAEQNNFILDGVDNNANVVDFYNGASYVVNPPPDALAELKIQTSDYSAEFGHSAGAVVNASIKSGTNAFHGDLWEYLRNNDLGEATPTEWSEGKSTPTTVPPYHQNLFGATLGGPFFKNKLFFFADAQADRIVYNGVSVMNVPSANERKGDFSELLNPTLLGASPIQLYYQDPSGASPPVPITNNCLVAAGTTSCPTSGSSVPLTLNATALKTLNLYPAPNNGTANLYNNYSATLPTIDNTFQWDARLDWTIGAKDSSYSRYSYYNEVGENTPPLGSILDGGGFGDGKQKNYGANYMFSESHTFSPTIVNEARFGFNYLHTGFQQPNAADSGLASTQGFGGIPAGTLNGGLPNVTFDGSAAPHNFGAPTWAATDEHNNVYQIIDNITKIAGSHALKAGVTYQNIRFSTLQPQEPRGTYTYSGAGTSLPGGSNTGYGLADFLLDQQNSASLSNAVTDGDQRANLALYLQDDWRVRRNLTFNLGVRYEYFQPYQEVGGYQASFNFLSKPTFNTTTGIGSVTGQYLIPSEAKSYAAPIISQYGFDTALANDGVKVVYDPNPRLQDSQHLNFAPRLGAAWSPDQKTAVRAGFGIFYGGLESLGYWGNLGENYPFQFTGSFPAPSCTANNCPTDGITVGNGFNTILSNGFASVVTNLNLRGTDSGYKSTYTEDWNLSIERSFMSDMVATISYVGNTSRHLVINIDPNSSLALEHPGNNTQAAHPMPDYGGSAYTGFEGMSDYHALQAKLEKRLSHGFNLLATYTWSHALDDAVTPLGSTGDGNFRQTNLIPFHDDYSNAAFDVRQRLTFNGLYDLPFGKGRAFMNHSTALDYLLGGWSADASFFAQTGESFTISPSGDSTASGFENGPFDYQVQGEYATGGTTTLISNSSTPPLNNCATKTKTITHWFNPCSYAMPWDAGDTTVNGAPNPHYIPRSATDPNTPAGDSTPVYVQSLPMVLGYAGGPRDIAEAPGFERVNMSVFKDFSTFHEQKLTFRADIFNLFNTPAWGEPNNENNSASGGNITSTRNLQNNAPDARFFQLSLKYAF
jgi:outer membrane receptor protein involved in Fe transport